jgi:hypothetical protein
VLQRPEFNLPRHEVLIVLRRIQPQAEYAVVSPAHLVRGLPDADDAPFAECAIALGCHLVSGNAWEWVDTIVFDSRRMLRGGSMSCSHEKMIASTRSNTSPTRRYPDVGLRVARRISPSDTKP